jgi:hypothetical protein
MFSNGFINLELDMGDEGVDGFEKNGIVYKCSPNQLTLVQPHYLGMGRGLV